MSKPYKRRSPQQRIHWTKLQLLGMLNHSKGVLKHIQGVAKIDITHATWELETVERKVKKLYDDLLAEQKELDKTNESRTS